MSNNQNLVNKDFMGFMHLRIKFKENFKPKTKLIKAEISILDKSRKNFSASQWSLKFENLSNGSGFNYIVEQSKSLKQSSSRDFPLCFQKRTQKMGKGCLLMIDN